MVAYTKQVRPGLDIRVGDLRDFRLGRTVDAILCLGNTLAYLHDNHDIQAAFATLAAHAHAGTVLILLTPIAPIERTEPRTSRVDTLGLHAQVTIHYEWDLRTQINTMYRHWLLDDSTEHQDTIRRRVLWPRELELYATLSGFTVVDMFGNPTVRTEPLCGPNGYVIAHYR
ncbi:MAG: hypothetical protein ACR2GH_05720 [Pseudonocardia sp.]